MRVLFDHNIPKKLRSLLPGHSVITSRELRWNELTNGELLAAAEANGFEVLVTGDKNLKYQQNLKGRKLALIVLGETDWNILKEQPEAVAAALENATPGSFREVLFQRRQRRPGF